MTTLDSEQWKRLQLLFEQALELPESERSSFLASDCSDDVLRAEVESLLRASASSADLLDRSPLARPDGEPAVDLHLRDDAIPGYRIVREMARGAQGVVYFAEQLSTQREVALKVMWGGPFADRASRRRFEREVEVISSLRHPAIVQLFDSGLVQGQYYYAMEFVHGEHLDDNVRRRRARITEVLDLFVRICDAVNHAHQHGVIHRDLKPSNVLVDDSGNPHVLDFGIAKLANGGAENLDTAVLSITGHVFGTLPYMSPEHASGRPSQVDTRSDVYSLGVILYELLTNRLPYDLDGTMVENLATIQSVEPKGLRTLDKRIDNELETIVLKALDKEPTRRYQTAGALGEDVERYLRGEAIEAKRDSALYVLQKTMQRHRTVVSVALSFVVLLVVALLVSSFLYIDAERAREAERLSSLEYRSARDRAQETAEVLRSTLYFSQMNLAGQSMQHPGGVGQMREILASWGPEQAGVDLRGWEWFLMSAFCHREQLVLKGHRSNVWSVDWSPDGSSIVSSCSGEGRLRIWDIAAGEQASVIETAAGRWVALSPDGTRLASCSFRGAVEIWDAADGRRLFALRGHTAGVTVRCVAWNRDGTKLASVSNDGKLIFWDVERGLLLRRQDLGQPRVSSVCWNRAGTHVVVGGAGEIAVIDAESGDELWAAGATVVESVRWSPDDSLIAAGSAHGNLRTFDAGSGEQVGEVDGNEFGSLWCLDWDPQSRQLVTAHEDRALRIWDARNLQVLQTLPGSTDQIYCVRWSPDGSRIVSGGADYAVRVWEVNQEDQTFVLDTGHNFMSSIDWDSKGSLIATIGSDACIRVWDVSRREVMQTIDLRPASGKFFGDAAIVRWSPDGARLAAAGSDNTVRIWDSSSGEEVRRFTIRSLRPICLDWHPGGVLLAAGCADGTVRIWDTRTGEEVAERPAGTIVRTVAWSPDGVRLAFNAADAKGPFVSIHAAVVTESDRRYRLEGRLRGHDRRIQAICWSPDGTQLATGSEDKTTRLWSLATCSEALPPMRHSGVVNSIDWLTDEKHPRVVCATNAGVVSVWDPLTGKLALTLETSRLIGRSASWSPDGRQLACASGRFLHVWDATPPTRPRLQVPAPVD